MRHGTDRAASHMSELLKVFPDWDSGHKFAVYCVRFRMVGKFLSICRFVSAEGRTFMNRHVRFFVAYMIREVGKSCLPVSLASGFALEKFQN